MNNLLFHHQKYLVNSWVLSGCFFDKFPYCNNFLMWKTCLRICQCEQLFSWLMPRRLPPVFCCSLWPCVLNVYSAINFRLVICCWSVEVACPCLAHNRVYYTNSWRHWSTWLHVWIWAGWHYWYSITCVMNGMTFHRVVVNCVLCWFCFFNKKSSIQPYWKKFMIACA